MYMMESVRVGMDVSECAHGFGNYEKWRCVCVFGGERRFLDVYRCLWVFACANKYSKIEICKADTLN